MGKTPISVEDRKKMSFLQAEGTVALPSQLQWGQLDRHIRLRFWDVLYAYFADRVSRRTGYGARTMFHDDAYSLALALYRRHVELPLDEAKARARDPDASISFFKERTLSADWDVCLDFIQQILRQSGSSYKLREPLVIILNSSRSPYTVIDDPPTIIPRGSPEEGETVVQDLEIIKQSGLSGARTHLISAAEALNKGDNRGAIREAIHAVESASKIIGKKPNATLPDCLKVLEKEHGLHPALNKAFDGLYGYTSDEKGIRHALIGSDNDNVGADEALLCSARVPHSFPIWHGSILSTHSCF